MNQIRLLHIVGNSKFGGAAKLILRLAQMSVEDGWQVDILTTDPTLRQSATKQGVGVIALDVIRREIRPWNDLYGLVRLFRFLRSEEYQVIHTHTSKGGFIGRLAARAAGAPVILHTVHGFAFHERSPFAKRAIYTALERLASRWCDRIVAVTEFHRRWALELGMCGESKIVAVPNGIAGRKTATKDRSAELRCLWKIQPEEPIFLTAGRLAPEKGLEDLIEAAALLQKAGRRFRVVLAGEGPLRQSLENRIRERGITDRIIFLGYRQDIAELLDACDLVVLPSVREGLSIALLEAMAAGKPIVATRIGGNLAVLTQEDMALMVPPQDPGALCQAISTYWLAPESLPRMGERVRQVFEQYYTEDRMLNSYRQLYRDLLRSNYGTAFSAQKRPHAAGVTKGIDV